jgi:cell division protein FtsB
MIALGLTGLFCSFGLGLYSLCMERQANFEAKLVELEELKSERRQLLSHNQRMRERVAYLQTDEGIEEVAREKLGLVRPGELAYAVVPPPPDSFVQADEKESPHLESAAHQAEHQEDFGLIVRVLRHLFKPDGVGVTAGSSSQLEKEPTPGA